MSQIENNSFNTTTNSGTNSSASTTYNNPNTNSNKNQNTTHFRARNINFPFMKELFKKNAILYIALLFAIPALGMLFTISDDGLGYYSLVNPVFDMGTILPFTFLLIFTIPTILSITLFSWVYKRKKVDFICSMPINRRTMCLSTTILGVFLILAISILYVSCTGFGCLVSAKHFFVRQLFENFVYMFLSMLFLFGICNLAMARAGNMVTQIVLILLLLFFIPLLLYILKASRDGGQTYTLFEQTERTIYLSSDRSSTNYLPIPMNTIFGEETTFISSAKVGQSLIYIVIIYVITQVLFEHRKMEENQESFKSVVIHEIVKSLTMLIPMALVAYGIFDENVKFVLALIFIIISIVYFIIYDLITAKKVKIRYSAITLVCVYIVSCIFGYVFYQNNETRHDNYFRRELSLSSVESLYIAVPCTASTDYIEIKDEKCIQDFINYVSYTQNGSKSTTSYPSNSNTYNSNTNKYKYDEYEYEYEYDAAEDEYNDEKNDVNTNNRYGNKAQTQMSKKTIRLSYRLKFNDNKLFYVSTRINEENFNKIFAQYLQIIKERAKEDIKNNSAFWEKWDISSDNRSYVLDITGKKVSEWISVAISDMINEIDKYTTFDLYEGTYDNIPNGYAKTVVLLGYYYNGFSLEEIELYELLPEPEMNQSDLY